METFSTISIYFVLVGLYTAGFALFGLVAGSVTIFHAAVTIAIGAGFLGIGYNLEKFVHRRRTELYLFLWGTLALGLLVDSVGGQMTGLAFVIRFAVVSYLSANIKRLAAGGGGEQSRYEVWLDDVRQRWRVDPHCEIEVYPYDVPLARRAAREKIVMWKFSPTRDKPGVAVKYPR